MASADRPKQLRQPLVDVGIAVLVVGCCDEARERVEQRARLGLALAQGAQRHFLGGDITSHQHHAQHALHRLCKRRVGGLQVLRRCTRTLVDVSHHADALRAQALAQRLAPLAGD